MVPEGSGGGRVSLGSVLSRLIFQKKGPPPFLRLLVREGSIFSGEALCMSPGPISLRQRPSHRLLSNLGEREILTLRIRGVSPGFSWPWEKPCFVGRGALECEHWVTSDSVSPIL